MTGPAWIYSADLYKVEIVLRHPPEAENHDDSIFLLALPSIDNLREYLVSFRDDLVDVRDHIQQRIIEAAENGVCVYGGPYPEGWGSDTE